MDAAVAQSPVTRGRGRRDGVRFEVATRADDPEIRRLLRENPMAGQVSISLEREPDAGLAAAIEGDVHRSLVARDPAGDGKIICMGSVSVRDAYVNGEVTRVGYLSQLRVDRRWRPRASVVIGGYRLFRELHKSLGAKVYFTSIASDNVAARRFLERGLRDMPSYLPIETFVTSIITPGRRMPRRPPGLEVESCGAGSVEETLECVRSNTPRWQFAPAWKTDELIDRIRGGEIRFTTARRRGRIVGCVATWDQSAYKQAVVRGYSPRLLRWRKWINLIGRPLNLAYLPPVGTALNLAYLSHPAVTDDDPGVFAALLAFACEEARAHHHNRQLVLGLSGRHPLLARIPRTFRRFTYRTTLYLVRWDEDGAAVEPLDGRVCQPEAALL